MKRLKQFKLIRDGEIVARGVIMPSGKAIYERISATPCISVYHNILAVEHVSCNGGKSTLKYVEEESEMLREYYLERIEDVSGVSGVGIVVRGIIFPSGAVVHEWLRAAQSLNYYDNYKQAEQTHGHNGCTVMKFVDKHGLPEIEE